MENKKLDIESYSIKIPELYDIDWNKAISEADGIYKELTICQARVANLLKSINDSKATFERISWISLWPKVFAMTDAIFSAVTRNSEYLIKILTRVSFEQMLQVYTIAEPIHKHFENDKTANGIKSKLYNEVAAWKETADRLKAYAAWCLWNDKQYFEELLHFKTQHGIFDIHPEVDIANDPVKLAVYESIFGILDAETDYRKVEKERLRFQDKAQRNLVRIKSWLNYRELLPWKEVISTKQKNKLVTFFSLFNESEHSIAKRLKGMDVRWMYASYKQGAMFIHGSSIENTLDFQNGIFTPLFIGTDESVKQSVDWTTSICNIMIMLLHILSKQLWTDENKGKSS